MTMSRDARPSSPDGSLALIAIASRTEANTRTIIQMLQDRPRTDTASTTGRWKERFGLASQFAALVMAMGKLLVLSLPFLAIAAAMMRAAWRWALGLH